MRWTNDKPTIEGWYFWRKRIKQTDSWGWHCYYMEQLHTSGDLEAWENGTDVKLPANGQWAGPIEEPE